MILHLLIAMAAGRIQRHQQQVITYLMEENRILKGKLQGHRLLLTDTERRRLAALAYPLGRKRLQEIATLACPYQKLVCPSSQAATGRETPLACPVVGWFPCRCRR